MFLLTSYTTGRSRGAAFLSGEGTRSSVPLSTFSEKSSCYFRKQEQINSFKRLLRAGILFLRSQEVGEERVVSGIPKVAGSEKEENNLQQCEIFSSRKGTNRIEGALKKGSQSLALIRENPVSYLVLHG